jgi:hypothetical protein
MLYQLSISLNENEMRCLSKELNTLRRVYLNKKLEESSPNSDYWNCIRSATDKLISKLDEELKNIENINNDSSSFIEFVKENY